MSLVRKLRDWWRDIPEDFPLDYSQITNNLYIGAWPTKHDVDTIKALGVTLVISTILEQVDKELGEPPLKLLKLRMTDAFYWPLYPTGTLERGVETALASGSIVTLQYYGSLFFASAQNFEDQLPHPTAETSNAVVIVNLRGQKDLDSTTLDTLTEYTQELQKHNCRLMLAGVEDSARQKLERMGKLAIIGSDNVFAVSEHYHESVLKARTKAQEWINK